MFISKLIWNLESSIVDAETTFLHGELQEDIKMNISEGMSYDSKHRLLLTKTINRLIQSAIEFYKKLMATLKSIGFKGNKSYPCLLSKWTQDVVIMIGIYVDDCLVIGKLNKINELIVELKTSGFNLKVKNNLTGYLSCQLIENAELKEILILQPHIINNLEAKFGDEVKSKRVYKTPGTPRFKIVHPKSFEDNIEPNLQSRYRSGVGMLLYLIKYS
jgi:hypothetical protein